MGTAGKIFLEALAQTPGAHPAADLAPDLAADLALASALDALIVAFHQSAAEIWRPVVLDLGTYARHLATCVAASPGAAPPEVVLDGLHTDDLYLACAAGHAIAPASELFVRHFLAPIAAAVQAIDKNPAFVDEVRQALHERLLIAGDAPPRILQYAGRASLSSWIGVAAQRLALGMLRSEGAHQRAAARAGDEPLELDLDPELQYLKTRYRDAFKEAITVAIAQLPQRQRTVMRLHTIGGLTLTKIAAMLLVDESTVSRWIQRARADILENAQRELGDRLGIRVAEVPSLARLVTSQLDVSVARLLSDDGPTASMIKESR